MSQAIFGSGIMLATPLTDAYGNAISNPTPIIIGTLQDASIDMSFETKSLHGSDSQFAKFNATGKGTISGKAKMGTIKGDIFSALFFGQSATNGLTAIKFDTAGSVIGVGLTITPTIPSAGTYLKDKGVVGALGLKEFKRVASSPATGQYSVNESTGEYTFASADEDKVVYINYAYTANISGAKSGDVNSIPMGNVTTFSIDLATNFRGKAMTLTLHSCIASKLSISTKLDDFAMPDLDFIAGQDESGKVFSWSTAE